MSMKSGRLALIFEFDEILAPDSTTSLVTSFGIDPSDFWSKRVKSLVQSGYDPVLAYMRVLLENIGRGKPLGPLTNPELRRIGSKLNERMSAGLLELFDDLKRICSRYRIEIEFYIISSGLKEVIDGMNALRRHVTAVHASELGEDDDGVLRYVKRCVTFTEKTRFLFEISKRLPPDDTQRNPFLVNRYVPPDERPIPFENMIFVGDPVTDIPCFSIIAKEGGLGFGVLPLNEGRAPKQALQMVFKPDRVQNVHAPKFGPTDELGALVRAAVATRCAQIQLDRERVREY